MRPPFFKSLLFTLLLLLFSAALDAQTGTDQLFTSAVEAQQHGDYASAIRDYQKLLQARPAMGEAHANLGAALAHTGRLDEAIAQYKLALSNAPDKDGVRLNLGLAYYKKAIDLIAHDAKQNADTARAGFEEASKQFIALQKIRPGDPQLAILLGDSEVRLGKGPEAVAMLTPLAAENAANPDFAYALGEAQIAAGQRREGAALLSKLAAETQSADVYMLAGSTLLDLNEVELARADLEAAVKLNPALPRVNTLVGIARDKTGDQQAAEPAFRDAVRQNPDDFEANLYLGAILYKRRDVEQAKPFLERALQLNPSDSMAEYESAMLLSTSGEYQQACTMLEALVKAYPDWLEPHVQLATVYYRLHRPEDGAKQRAVVEQLTAQQQVKGPGK